MMGKIENVQETLGRIEELGLSVDEFKRKSAEVLRNLFPNLKRLRLSLLEYEWKSSAEEDDAPINPKIEFFDVDTFHVDVPLNHFFDQFPNLRGFGCFNRTLLTNSHWIETTHRTIVDLNVFIWDEVRFDDLFNLLNLLHASEPAVHRSQTKCIASLA